MQSLTWCSSFRGWLALMLVAACALPAPAQQRRGQDREGVRLSGKLVALQPGLMQVEAKDGETWLIKVEARGNDLMYTATAKPEWLRPGMWVRFRASFDQRGRQQTELADVTVFTPQEGQQLGLIPEVSLGDGLFSDEEEERKKERSTNQVTPYVVAGRIVGFKKSKMTVAAGNVPVTVEVPDTLRVAVEVADYSLAQPGDAVEIQGWKYPMVPGRAIANRLTVNSENVLGNPPPAARRKKGGEQDAGRDGEDQPGRAASDSADADSAGPGAKPATGDDRPDTP